MASLLKYAILPILFATHLMISIVAIPLPVSGDAAATGIGANRRKKEEGRRISNEGKNWQKTRRRQLAKSLMEGDFLAEFGKEAKYLAMEAAMAMEAPKRRPIRKKRNLVTDLIAPHMQWEEYESRMISIEEATQIYNNLRPALVETIENIRAQYHSLDAENKEKADEIIRACQTLLDGGPSLIKTVVEH